MDAKSFREKMEALYKGVSQNDKNQDDKWLLYRDKLSIRQKERYAVMTDDEKTELNRKAAEGWAEKQGTLTPEQKKQMVIDTWNTPREDEDLERIAKKYNTTVKSVKGNTSLGKYIDPTEFEHLKKQWYEQFSFMVEIRSPGNDLLNYYDEMNELRGHNIKLNIPPSAIFHIRFRLKKDSKTGKNPTARAVYEYAKQWYDNGVKNDSDWSYYKSLIRLRLPWLVDEPAKRHIVFSQQEMYDFMQAEVGNRATANALYTECPIKWHTSAGAGYSFRRITDINERKKIIQEYGYNWNI